MDRADLGEILDGLDLTDASAMAAARQEYEDALDTALERVTEEFLTGVIEDAVEALSSATLVAAGQPRGAGGRFVADPFSFTQVMKRWRTGIRQLESLTDLSEQSVRMILDGSDLPQWAFDDVSEALRRADEEGWTALRTKRELGAILIPRDDRGRWDSRARYRASIRMIARTLATENYSLRMTGTLATMGFELKEWVSRHDSRTRVSHAIADGQRVRLGDRFIVGASRMLYPGDPAAPIEETANCFPADVRVEAGEVSAAMRREYAGELVEVRTGEGVELSGTPNHPVLTSRGWVALGDLEQGDHLVRHLRDVEPSVGHDVEAGPSEIGQLYDAFSVSRDSVRVAAGGVDFHGERPESDVEVVGADGLLETGMETPADQLVGKLSLVSSEEALAGLVGEGPALERLPRVGHASPGGVGGNDAGEELLGSALGGEELVGLGAPPARYSPPLEEPLDSLPSDSEALSEGLLGLPGQVALDEVVGLSRRPFSGHVYNLSTGTGAYSANGIISHNCRCVLVGANPPKKGRKMNSTARKQARRVAAEGQAQPRLFEAAQMDTYAELAADEDVKEAEDEAAEEVAEEVESEPDGEGPDLVMWHGVIGMEKTMTGDGRLIEENALRWEDLPIPLRYVSQDVGGHGGAEVVGTIQVIEREEDGRILGTGTMDAQSPVGQEAIRQVAEGLNRGVSMDLDDVSFEVRVAEDVLAAHEAMLDGDGSDTEARAVVDGKVVMLEMSSDDEVHVTTSARIRAATIVSIPAFAEAQIDLVDDDTLSDEEAIGALDDDDEISEDEIEETYNWVDDVGGLPGYIRRIADHLMASGMTESRAIASAVNTVKRWARGGTVRRNGGPRVSAKTAAKAAAAVAEWEAKRIRARASAAGTDAFGAKKTVDSLYEDVFCVRCREANLGVLQELVASGWSSGLVQGVHPHVHAEVPGGEATGGEPSTLAAGEQRGAEGVQGAESRGARTEAAGVEAGASRGSAAVRGPSSIPEARERDGRTLLAGGDRGARLVDLRLVRGEHHPDTLRASGDVDGGSHHPAGRGRAGRKAQPASRTLPMQLCEGCEGQVKIRARASSAGTSALSLTASGGPLAPPAAWFEDPQLSEPTALQITSEGRVYGHLAVWDACHIAHPQECVSPPSSPSGYAYFHTGALLTAEGTEVAIGHLTMDTGHAADQDTAMAALAHYDNSGTVGADIRVGEDAHGIWVAGGVRPGVSDEKLRSLRAAPISGDWRRLQGSLELVAALAVNVPGFAVPRPHGRRQNGNTVALVASGMVPPRRVKRPGTEGALSESDLRYLRALARREKRQQAQEMARQIRRDRVEAVARELGH